MTERPPEDLKHELQALDQAHAQNEAARDSFVALAHTALFAASVSFVGSAVPLAKAVWRWALIGGWAVDVFGLLALTISFATARKAIDARRAAIYADVPPIALWSERLNGLALWSFPLALLCLFSFVTANVVYIDDQQTKPSATTTPVVGRIEGRDAAPSRALAAGGRIATANGRHSGTSCPCGTTSPSATPTAVKEVAPVARQ